MNCKARSATSKAARLAQPAGIGFERRQSVRVTQKPGDLVSQGSDVVDLDGGHIFQQEIAIAAFLPRYRVDDHHRGAAGQRFRRRQAARFGHDQVGGGHQLVDLVGEAEDLRQMARRRLHSRQLCSRLFISPRDDYYLERRLHVENGPVEFLDGADAETAGQLQHDGPVISQTVFGATGRVVLGLTENRVDGDAGYRGIGRRHPPMMQVAGAFLRGSEVVIARLVDPEAMRLEVRGDGDLRDRDALLLA